MAESRKKLGRISDSLIISVTHITWDFKILHMSDKWNEAIFDICSLTSPDRVQ